MAPLTALAAFAGGLVGLGVLMVILGMRRTGTARARTRMRLRTVNPDFRWAPGAVLAGIAVLALTGWPIAALAAGVGVLGIPKLMGGRRDATRRLERLAALGDWTRRLADVLVAGAGLEHAIDASVRAAPAPIAADVARLGARLRARRPLSEALHGFADDLADPTGDLVVSALLLAAHRRGRGLARVLTGLAVAVDADVAMRRSVDAQRATPRTTARYLTAVTVITVVGLMTLRSAYMAPFGTVTGQLVLALVGVLFASGFAWMATLTKDTPGQRFLPATNTAGQAIGATPAFGRDLR
jgi:Flp pilus assembly protein TadB